MKDVITGCGGPVTPPIAPRGRQATSTPRGGRVAGRAADRRRNRRARSDMTNRAQRHCRRQSTTAEAPRRPRRRGFELGRGRRPRQGEVPRPATKRQFRARQRRESRAHPQDPIPLDRCRTSVLRSCSTTPSCQHDGADATKVSMCSVNSRTPAISGPLKTHPYPPTSRCGPPRRPCGRSGGLAAGCPPSSASSNRGASTAIDSGLWTHSIPTRSSAPPAADE